MRVASAYAAPLAPGWSQALATAAYRCSSDQTFDPEPMLAVFPCRLTRLADLARRWSSVASRGERPARRANRAA